MGLDFANTPDKETNPPVVEDPPPATAAPVLLRWIVPALFAACMACFLMDLWKNHQRIVLAREVGNAILQGAPTTLPELEALLGDHCERVKHFPASTYSPAQHPWVSIYLSPHLLLKIKAALSPNTDHLENMQLLFFSSTPVPLDRPEKILPGLPPWHWWLVILATSLFPAGLSVVISQRPHLHVGWRIIGAITVLAPLLCWMMFAGAALIRISL